jgi:hypothetical protein
MRELLLAFCKLKAQWNGICFLHAEEPQLTRRNSWQGAVVLLRLMDHGNRQLATDRSSLAF